MSSYFWRLLKFAQAINEKFAKKYFGYKYPIATPFSWMVKIIIRVYFYLYFLLKFHEYDLTYDRTVLLIPYL